jgi:hypothetical protein
MREEREKEDEFFWGGRDRETLFLLFKKLFFLCFSLSSPKPHFESHVFIILWYFTNSRILNAEWRRTRPGSRITSEAVVS